MPNSVSGDCQSSFSTQPKFVSFTGRPIWVDLALHIPPASAPHCDTVQFPTSQKSAVVASISEALGIPVTIHFSSLRLEPVSDPSQQAISLSAADALVRVVISRRGPGKQQLQVLSEAYERCAKMRSCADGSVTAPVLELLQFRLAHKGLLLIMDDDADIYYEDGQQKAELQAGLVNQTLSSSFLGGMLSCVSGEQEMEVFEPILSSSFRYSAPSCLGM